MEVFRLVEKEMMVDRLVEEGVKKEEVEVGEEVEEEEEYKCHNTMN